MAIKRNIVVLVLCALFLAPAYGESVKDLQKKQKKLQEEIEQTNKMLKQTKKDESATMNKLQLIGQNIKTQKKLINTLDNEITALNREMRHLNATRDSLQKVLEGYKNDYAEMVRQSHYARMQQSPLLFLLSSDSFQQLARRARYLQEFARYRQEQVKRIENTQAEIDTQNELLKANKNDKQTALSNKKKEQENHLKRDERKQKTMLNQLKTKEKDLTKQIQQKQKKVNELNKKIDDIVRQQAEKASKTTLTKEQQLIAGGFEANKGRLPWPVEKGMISGHFGKQQHPVYAQVIMDNKGIYLQTMVNGTYAVIIQHGNYRTVYSNLSKLSVKQGDKVETKQALGTIFTDPEQDRKTELYFQVYKDRDILNPELWITR